MKESAKQEFTAKLEDVFTHIMKEDTFVEASLVQDMRDPESILNYEIWNESPESFMKNQMSKTYRAEFEKMTISLVNILSKGHRFLMPLENSCEPSGIKAPKVRYHIRLVS
jgi:quinol monooxygenase YgiN